MAPSLLKVLGGPLDGKELIIEDAVAEVVVGAGPGCTFRLELPGVSPVHARLRREAGGVTVHDAASERGVFVNDDRVLGTAVLRSGDILWLGPPGDAQSVMIQCRLTAAPGAATPTASLGPLSSTGASGPAAETEPEIEVEPFFIEEPAAALEQQPAAPPTDEFLLAPDSTLEPPAAEPPAVVVEDTFFFDVPGPPPAADDFFIAEPEPAPSPPEPAGAPRPATPVPPPGPPSSPAPPAATPRSAPPASTPAAPPPAPPRTATPAATRAEAKPPLPSAPAAGRAASQPPSPVPARKPQGVTARPTTARPRATAAAQAPKPAPRAGRAAKARTVPGRYVALAALGLLLLGSGYVALRLLRRPQLDSVSPTRARVGEVVTLVGGNFSTEAIDNRVLFGDQPAKVVRATAAQIEAEIPELPTIAGRDAAFAVTVEVGGRRTEAVEVQVFQSPRIHGLSPDVARPGDELTLAGSGWGPGATVRFGALKAEVLETMPTSLRVRVPAIDGAEGTSVPVVVAMGDARSNEAPFMVGRLPLLQRAEPAMAAPGDLVTLTGRGFHIEPERNAVQIGGAPALVVGSTGGTLQVVVPWSTAGEAALEVRVSGSGDVARTVFGVAAAPDPVAWRFVAEPFVDAAGHAHAFVGTALGPAFVLSSSGGKSAAQRAVEAAQRLNDAAGPLRASLDAELEARGATVRLMPKDTTIVEATAEDAAAYEEDWTRLGSRGGRVTPERLAQWWAALARDLVLVVVRSQKPSHTAAAGPEGRILGEVFQAARRTGRFGLPRQVVADLNPGQRHALRVLAQRVPAGVAGGTARVPGTAGAASLRLQGNWTGFETQAGQRKNIALSFGRGGGTLTFTDGVGIGVPLLSAETPQRNTLLFSAQVRGGVRYYLGSWDGERVKGRISVDAAGRNAVGTFELVPGP